jgi:hypothetical protein
MKKVRRSQASRAKRRKARRQAERTPLPFLQANPSWLGTLLGSPDVVGAVLKAGAAIVDHLVADLHTDKTAEDSALLDVARAKVGQVRLQGPTCCFATTTEPRCGKAAPRFFAREGVEHGPELALCDEHAERVRAWLPVTDRTPPVPVRLYDPEKS